MTRLNKLSVSSVAAELKEPFSMVNVALIGDILASVYICQGRLDYHKHLDIDELFWVHEGAMLLESEWGQELLGAGELAVVPKGVEHRSSAVLRTVVLLMRCGFNPQRKNGRRRLYAIADEASLKRVGLQGTVQALSQWYQFETVARVDDSVVQVAQGEGIWPAEVPATRDVLLYVLNGTATVLTSQSMLHLHPGDFTVVPQGAVYQFSTTPRTALVRVTRGG